MWTLGKARPLWDLASLSLFAILVVSAFQARGDLVLAFWSSPLPVDRSLVTLPADSLMHVPVEKSESVGEEPAVSSTAWQRPVGLALVVLGVALVVGGLLYLIRQ
jgi:hypothetical protein